MKIRASAIAGMVLIGLSAGQARAQVVPVGHFNNGCAAPDGCGQTTQVCLVVVPCEKHQCSAKGFLENLFGLNGCDKAPKRVHKHKTYAQDCAPTCTPACAPACTPAPAACATPCPAPCAPPAPKCVAVPVRLMYCQVAAPAPCPTYAPAPCPTYAPAPCPTYAPAPCPTCPPGCVPAASYSQFGHLGLFHKKHYTANGCVADCGQPTAAGCPTCGVPGYPYPANAQAQPGQPSSLPPANSLPTAGAPQGAYGSPAYGQPTAAPQAMPQTTTGVYGQLIQSIQSAQERDNRAIREMIESRQATQAVVRALQSSDANTVDMFEKMLQQMKSNPAQPASPTSAAPRIIAPPIPGTSMAPATNSTAAMDDMKAILRDLQAPVTAVRTASK